MDLVESTLLFYSSSPRLALAVGCGLLFVIYYLTSVAKQPMFACKEGKFREFLLLNCPILKERYWPTLWCFSTHAQTVLAHLFRGRLPNLPYRREILKLPDGGMVSLDWLDNSLHHGETINKPIALFLPGLTGHSQTEYVKSLVPVAHRLGCRCVVFNNRGIGGVDLLTPRTYCAANTEDLREVLKVIQFRYPNSLIFATGVSLGGIILGHYLEETGSNSVISAAMLISVAWDCHAGSQSLEIPGLNLMLNHRLTNSLCRMIREHKNKFEIEAQLNMDHVLQSRTIREFDERFTTKIFGFECVDHYYTRATLRGRLDKIKTPTLCVNAADDMFAPFKALPHEEAAQSSHVAMVITSRGGHIGFMEGLLPAVPFFSERLFEQYLTSLIQVIKYSTLSEFFCIAE